MSTNIRRPRRCVALTVLVTCAATLTLSACRGGGDSDDGPVSLITYEATDGKTMDVYSINPETRESVKLTNAESYEGQPAWSPDRSRIIYISDAGQDANVTDVYTMAADGSDVQRLTNTPDAAERSPKYSPDGSRIAMALRRDGDYFLITLAPDGSDEQILAGPFEFVEFPSWRRDGGEIYFAAIDESTQATDILSVNVATKAVTVRISTPSADVCPHFSFDEQWMTYARSPGGENEEPDLFRRPLELDDVSGASDERLTDSPARDDYGNPSPDDEQYVFLSNRDGNFDLYLMDFDGGNVTRLTNTPDLRENVPDW